jgi:hypothetical protein
MEYRATVEDATVWTHPWTALLLMHRTDQKIYEFACHEGNFLSIKGLLEGPEIPGQASLTGRH